MCDASPSIAFCGVDCSACPDFRNNVCPSCKQSVWEDGDPCMPVKCCQDKQISFCAYCREFPCADMAEFYEESDGHRDAYQRMKAMREQKNQNLDDGICEDETGTAAFSN